MGGGGGWVVEAADAAGGLVFWMKGFLPDCGNAVR
jgi:hypothetical protein